MKLSNLEMTEKYINVQENDKDVQENDMLLAEVRRQVNPLSFCACTYFVQRIHITPHRTSAEERGVLICFALKSESGTINNGIPTDAFSWILIGLMLISSFRLDYM